MIVSLRGATKGLPRASEGAMRDFGRGIIRSLRPASPWRSFKRAVSRAVWAAILRAHPQLSEQEPANSTSGDEDEECRHPAVVQKADYDIDHESHQERQYRAQQNGSHA
jgi:hypothetical protein